MKNVFIIFILTFITLYLFIFVAIAGMALHDPTGEISQSAMSYKIIRVLYPKESTAMILMMQVILLPTASGCLFKTMKK